MPLLIRIEKLLFFGKGVPLALGIGDAEVYLLNLVPELFQVLDHFRPQFRNIILLLPVEVLISPENNIQTAQ